MSSDKPTKQPVPAATQLRQATAAEIDMQLRAEQEAREALPATRSTAEKWGATIAAIFTAIGVASVLQGREAIQRLLGAWEPVAGAVGLGALLLALVAIGFAAIAAQGTPRKAALTGFELRDYEITEAAKARGRLRASRILTGIAVLMVIGALAVLWYAPDGSTYLLIERNGNAVCVSDRKPPEVNGVARVIKVDECTIPSQP
jgi:hypothetical protein